MSLTQPPGEPNQTKRSRLQAILPYTTVAMILAALYVGWVFYSRYESNRRAEQAIQRKRAEQNKQFLDQVYGSGEIRFTTMAADSGVVTRGQTTQLCYGVVNARTVKIDPPVEQLKPTYYHCMQVAPTKTTTYTITAADGAGHTKSESLTIQVK